MIYTVLCGERDPAIAGLISSQSSYTTSLSIFVLPLSLFLLLFVTPFFLSLFVYLCHWMWAQWTWIIFTALLKAPLNGEIPNPTASCSQITHFTAIDAGSVSSNTQRCCCIKINLWWASQAITEIVEQQINIQSDEISVYKKSCWWD